MLSSLQFKFQIHLYLDLLTANRSYRQFFDNLSNAAMTAPAEPRMSVSSKDLKPANGFEAVHDEKVLEQNGVEDLRGDYSGAAVKTDPAEIALVRKLDRMIMVSLDSSISIVSVRDC